MVRDRTTDGVRLAELLSSEIHGRESGPLGRLAVTDAGRDAELRVRPKAVDPPRTLLFVEDGAEVKRATDVLAAVAEAVSETDGD